MCVEQAVSDLLSSSSYVSEGDLELIQKAISIATDAHSGQKRASGVAFITHPLSVALLLAKQKVDAKCIIAAVLHDVLEDTLCTEKRLNQAFGDEVTAIVVGLTKLQNMPHKNRDVRQAENFGKMLMAMSKDVRVLVIKLADRLHNMQTIAFLSKEKQVRIAEETLFIYAPMARRLGMSWVNLELENLSFQVLYPLRYAVLDKELAHIENNNQHFWLETKAHITKVLEEAGVKVLQVLTRRKHTYSVYRKMRDKRLTLPDVMDVFAIRVLVDDVLDCYRCLGVLHQLYRPMLSKFKDYIALPKANGYQSLHTVLFGPKGIRIEAQIRTVLMDRFAETGVASHFIYKQGHAYARNSHSAAQKWFDRLMALKKGVGDSLEFMEHVKIDLYPGEVYVFTPSGDIIELPKGATALDFAYAIHTRVGHCGVMAKINQQISPLSTVLFSGQSVQILTKSTAKPHELWLGFVVTSRAKTAIRDYFKTQRRDELVQLGTQILTKNTLDAELFFKHAETQTLEGVASHFEKKTFEQVLEAIALGRLSAKSVRNKIRVLQASLSALKVENEKPLRVSGNDHLAVNYANCCHPIPGDWLLGFLSAGEGLYIHRRHCPYAQELIREDRYERFNVEWSSQERRLFTCKMALDLINQRGVLAVVAQTISELGCNIEEIRADKLENNTTRLIMRLGVLSRAHLSRVMKSLRRERIVLRIKRLFGDGGTLDAY